MATGNVWFGQHAPARGGILRAGDAAGYIHPLAGDGMAMAVRSGELAAAVLGAALRGELARGDVAPLYGASWHREFGRRLEAARRLQPLFVAPHLMLPALALSSWVPALGALGARATRG